MPDKDVFVIDATADPPRPVSGPGGFYAGVGTTLFNMIVNPVSGKVYVSNTDARNDVRFSGAGNYARSVLEPLGRPAPFTVQGHLVDSRITVLDGSAVQPRYLNKHVDYAHCCDRGVFVPDRSSEAPLADSALRRLAARPGQEVTFTCVPNGSGRRMALDRDLDGTRNRDEDVEP